MINILHSGNASLYAAKNYDNPGCTDVLEFYDDLKRFKYIKRLFKKYITHGELKHHLLLNHLIICFNVFGEATIPLLFYKIEREYWSLLKTFLVFLNRVPVYPKSGLNEIPIDDECERILNKI